MPKIAKRYYPALSSIVDVQKIPEELGFVREGIIALFDKLHYKDLQYNKSPRGDAAFYSLSIVTAKKLGFEIPGTGIALVLNPDTEDGQISAFPITLEYQWKILGYLRQFKSVDWSTVSAQEIFELTLMVLNISEEQALALFIKLYVVPNAADKTALEQFVEDINAAFPSPSIWSTPLPVPSKATTLKEITQQINAASGEYATLIAFSIYLLNTDPATTLSNVKTYFKTLMPQDVEAYIKDVLLPDIKATFTLSAGMEFPRTMLKPTYDVHGNNPFDGTSGHEPYTVIPEDSTGYPKVLLTMEEALFYANTATGFGYNVDLVFNTFSTAQLGNTPLVINVKKAKIDLSESTNIAQADADGRPKAFKGVFIEYAEIKLPILWENDSSSSNPKIITRNLLIGSEGGVSGTIGISGATGGNSSDNTRTKWLSFKAEKPDETVDADIKAFTYRHATGYVKVEGKRKTGAEGVEEEAQFRFQIKPNETTRVRDADNTWFDLSVANQELTVSKLDTAPNSNPSPEDLSQAPLRFSFNGIEVGLNEFSLTFHQNKIVQSRVWGQILIPQFNSTPLNVVLDIANGFLITVFMGQVSSAQPFEFGNFPSDYAIPVFGNDGSLVSITLKALQIGKINDAFKFGFAGAIDTNLNLPVVNKFIPNNLTVNKFLYSSDKNTEFDLAVNWKHGLNVQLTNEGLQSGGIQKTFPINKKKIESL